jgi:DNA-directed RNA polymerase III subunit RPC6
VQIDEVQTDDGDPIFALIAMSISNGTPLNDIPCGQCPVIHECADGNDVSPATCPYMKAWLNF